MVFFTKFANFLELDLWPFDFKTSTLIPRNIAVTG